MAYTNITNRYEWQSNGAILDLTMLQLEKIRGYSAELRHPRRNLHRHATPTESFVRWGIVWEKYDLLVLSQHYSGDLDTAHSKIYWPIRKPNPAPEETLHEGCCNCALPD
jgi:hypothetical protein